VLCALIAAQALLCPATAAAEVKGTDVVAGTTVASRSL